MAHVCSIFLRGTGGWRHRAGFQRQLTCARWTSHQGKVTPCCRASPSPTYVISRDEKEVAFTTMDSGGESQIWLASLDRRTPPRLIARAGDQVSFGRCRRVDLPVAGREQRAGPDQDGRNGPRANTDGVRPGEGRGVARRRVGDHPRTWDWQGCCPRHARRPHPWRRSQDHLLHMLSNVVSRREVLLCRERPERFPDLRGKDARDSCAGWQVVAGSARCRNQRCRWGRWTARRRDDRGWPDLARTRPLNLRFHQDRLAAQSLSHPPALACACSMRERSGPAMCSIAPEHTSGR